MTDLSASLRLELLESRRAPATMVDAKTVTFQDPALDTATIVLSKPVLTVANVDTVFKFDTGSVNNDNSAPQQLQTIDLTGFKNGLGITVGVKNTNIKLLLPVDVGFVNAAGVDLKSVTVSGDLGKIVAGDANKKTPGLGSLAVGSMGVQGTSTQAAGGDRVSTITGSLGKFTSGGDLNGEFVSVDGSIGKLTIVGSIAFDPALAAPDNGRVAATGSIGPVFIGGDLRGGPTDRSGSLYAQGKIGSVTLIGNMVGDGLDSGLIHSSTKLGSVIVGGDLTGGNGDESASIYGQNGIGNVALLGNVTGGAGAVSAAINVDSGRIGAVFIDKNLTGGSGGSSAAIQADRITSVFIGGAVTGAGGEDSAAIQAGQIGAVTTFGNIGGSGDNSASIQSEGRLGKVLVSGDLTGGDGKYSASISGTVIAGVEVTGNVLGGTGAHSANIEAFQSIGTVTVDGDWTGASIAAGWQAGPDNFFGTADDVANQGAKAKPIAGKIAKINILGQVSGTAAPGDNFAFEASQIGGLSINQTKVALKAGPKNDNIVLDNANNDFSLIEK
jgi:hypothetical protein